MKKFIASALVSFTLVSGAIAGPIDDYNAKLSTPAAKAAFLKQTCASQDTNAFFRCEYMKKNGVPDSNVRIGLVAAGAILGSAAGAAVVSNPALVGQTGAFHVFGYVPTTGPAMAWGAVTGGVAAGAAAY